MTRSCGARARRRSYRRLVNDVIDIRGASGACYRFRRVPAEVSLPATSGNFLYLREAAGKTSIVGAGTADALTKARDRWPDAVRGHAAEAIFVRLNLSRRVRLHEHNDIVSHHGPPMNLAEEGHVPAREVI